MPTQAERITALETEMSYVKDELREINAKLDDLLALKYKGAGAFWLATSLFGISFAGLITMVLSWWRS